MLHNRLSITNFGSPIAVGPANVDGIAVTVPRSDHVHEGVHSISAVGQPQVLGDVTLSAGARIILTQVGNDIEIASGAGILDTGAYTGNAAATQAIIGVGFQPRVVQIYRQFNTGIDVGFKTDQDGIFAKFCRLAGPPPAPIWYYSIDMIISLDPDGFTVGDGTGIGNVFNVAPVVYTYIAWA